MPLRIRKKYVTLYTSQFDALIVLKHIDGVPVAPLALHPTTGGPKNLPVAKSYLSDLEDEENAELSKKPHLVIVGGGWGVSTNIR